MIASLDRGLGWLKLNRRSASFFFVSKNKKVLKIIEIFNTHQGLSHFWLAS